MMSKITVFSIVCMITLGIFLGFSISDNPYGSKSNTSSSEQSIINPPSVSAAYYTDDFNGANDTTSLKARGYKVYYRGGGPQGLGATWFQGNSAVFSAYEGPATGYVGCNFQVVTGTNNIDSWLVLPRLNVSSGDTISFWNRSTDPGSIIYPDSFRVMYSASGDSTPEGSWVELGRFMAPNGPWTRRAYTAPSSGANARFAIRYAVVNGGPSGNNSDYSGVDYLNVATGTGGGGTCTYSWSAQTSGTTSQLYSVSAVSDMIGWAAGAGPTVVRTTNGGSTWTNATGTGIGAGESIYNIYAWSANDALCTTSPGATNIYKTTNGGTTWTNVFTLAGGFINAIQMVSATEGYAEGDPVGGKWTILKTTNGGLNWARMATEPAQVGSDAGWNNSFLISGTHIWFGTNGTKVYHSPDLGLTWSSGATTGTVNTYAVHFNTTTNGLAGGNAMVKSVDGGTTYTAVTNPGTSGNINGIEGNGTDWWAIRSSAVIYRSTDAGATWTSPYTQTGAVFQDIDFAVVGGCPKGWAVGNSGAIAKMVTTTGVSNYNTEIPGAFELAQNYPNPFNPTTNIKFSIPQSGLAVLKVYDVVGKEVATLVNEVKNAGNYIVGFNASNLPSGTYFYRLEMNNFTETKKMMLIK
ncbi:MAG: Ycf48-like protein [Ignavibacteria bacterium]|nr:Ycf48-like protein [Ignavibacteria bacterium]